MVLSMVALSAASCHSHHTLAMHVSVCGALCGDPNRAADDFSGIDCATQARVAIFPAVDGTNGDGGVFSPLHQHQPIAVHCFDLTQTPLSQLFSTGTSSVGKLPLAFDDLGIPQGSVIFEVALYGPNGDAVCPDDHGSWVALGRSPTVNLNDASITSVDVALGCHLSCPDRSNVLLAVHALEDDSPIDLNLTPHITFGDIFPFEILESTAGRCEAPPSISPHGEFRDYTGELDSSHLFSTPFRSDDSATAGCVTARIDSGSGINYACLGDLTSTTATAWPIRDHVLLENVKQLGLGAANVPLAIRVLDDAGTAAVGAHVHFVGIGDSVEAEYITDSSWSQLGGKSVGATGVAIFRAAPTGQYRVDFTDGTSVIFNAGGADDQNGVTTFRIQE